MESGIHDCDIMERVIPMENVQLMFHYKTPFVVFHSDHTFIKQPRSIISGLTDSYSDVSTNGEAGVVFISFYPAGACHFFDFPLSEIENQSIDLSDIFNKQIKEIEEKLCSMQTIKGKVAVIEDFLVGRFVPLSAYDSLIIQKGVEYIRNCKGQTNATLLSEALSVTPKTLERKFSHYVGKTTKQVIKLIRFQEVLRDFSRNKNTSITERAYNYGYYDQSHFIHDFKTYSGYTPKEFIAKYPDFDLTGSC